MRAKSLVTCELGPVILLSLSVLNASVGRHSANVEGRYS